MRRYLTVNFKNKSRYFIKLQKIALNAMSRYLDKIDIKLFMNDFEEEENLLWVGTKSNKLSLGLMSRQTYKGNIRATIAAALSEVHHKRTSKKWTNSEVIGFMSNVFNLWKLESEGGWEDDFIDQLKIEISEEYNVPVNRLNTQMALFVRNYEENNSAYDIGEYFDRYELLMWKYRDIEKLNDDIENNKINEEDLIIVKELFGV